VEHLTQPNLAFKYQTRMEVAISDSPSIPLSFLSMPSIFLFSLCDFLFLSVFCLCVCDLSLLYLSFLFSQFFNFVPAIFLFSICVFPFLSVFSPCIFTPLPLSLDLLSMPSLLCLFIPFSLCIYFHVFVYCLCLSLSIAVYLHFYASLSLLNPQILLHIQVHIHRSKVRH
jgi:hypothetical protein